MRVGCDWSRPWVLEIDAIVALEIRIISNAIRWFIHDGAWNQQHRYIQLLF